MRALTFSSFVNLGEESQFPKYDKFSTIFNDVMRLKAMLLVMTKAQMSLVVILLAVQTVGSWPPTKLRSTVPLTLSASSTLALIPTTSLPNFDQIG